MVHILLIGVMPSGIGMTPLGPGFLGLAWAGCDGREGGENLCKWWKAWETEGRISQLGIGFIIKLSNGVRLDLVVRWFYNPEAELESLEGFGYI